MGPFPSSLLVEAPHLDPESRQTPTVPDWGVWGPRAGRMPGLLATRGQTLPRTRSRLLIHGFQGPWEEARSPFCVLQGGRAVGLGAITGPTS